MICLIGKILLLLGVRELGRESVGWRLSGRLSRKKEEIEKNLYESTMISNTYKNSQQNHNEKLL